MSDTSVSAVSALPTASDPAYATQLASMAGIAKSTSTGKSTLDQSDFLNLMTTQLANQDPLNPMTDLNSIAQMATFAGLQQTSDLVTNLKSFMTQQTWSSAQSYLGKWVLVSDSGGGMSMGAVTSVAHDSSGNPVLTVNGKDYSPSAVSQVRDSAPTGTDASGTGTTTSGTDTSTTGTGTSTDTTTTPSG